MTFFDVNLRPPFADPALVIDIAKRSDVVKLNDDEVGRLASSLKTREATLGRPQSLDALAEACATLAKATNVSRICVTRGAEGAALWESGNLVCASAPKVTIKDTVGAGDSFMAALMVGLARGTDTQKALENACRVGAFVASHDGATPVLSSEIIRQFKGGFDHVRIVG
jgi:fructokinase